MKEIIGDREGYMPRAWTVIDCAAGCGWTSVDVQGDRVDAGSTSTAPNTAATSA